MTDLTHHKNNQSLSRREALKTLAAAGGGVVFSTLPKNWETPRIVAGNLPAFAQASPLAGTPILSNPSVRGPLGNCDPGGGLTGNVFLVSSDYNDLNGDVLVNQARVRATIDFPSGLSTSQEVPLGPTNISGDGFTGAINAALCVDFGSDPHVLVTLVLVDAIGLEATPVTIRVDRP